MSFQRDLLSFRIRDRFEPILQSEAAECGLACIANVLACHGHPPDLGELRRRFPISIKGMTLATILRVAEAVGLQGRAYRVEMPILHEVRTPAILHWQMSHFVVLRKVSGSGDRKRFEITDPAFGNVSYSEAEVANSFTGVVAEFEQIRAFAPELPPRRISLNSLWSHQRGLGLSILQIAIVTLVSQLLVLGLPMYLQVALDAAVSTQELGTIQLLGVAFLCVALLAGLVAWFRGALVLALGQEVTFQLGINLTRHIFSLPAAWFSTRNRADILSRLTSIEPVSDFISKQSFSAIVALISWALYAAALGLYSARLLLLSLAIVLIYWMAKSILIRILNERNIDALQAQARENSMMIENLEGMSSIKSFGVEQERLVLWMNRKAIATSKVLGVGRVQNLMDSLQPLLFSVEIVAFAFVAVSLTMAGTMTLGMLLAAVIYRQGALTAGIAFVDVLIAYRGLKVHLERVGDVALEPAEPQGDAVGEDVIIGGRISLQGIVFSYGIGERPVLNGVELVIEPGETVAITGKSGCGKSTLLSLVAGLISPTDGRVFVDGRDLADPKNRHLRRQVAYVAQEGQLFEGSIADNIAFFEAARDMDRVIEAAKLAAIHEEIWEMPMRYETLVGDMGSSLSGGQKARVLIARALYRKPRVLLVDEGSAHLDLATERTLNDGLERLGITRVVVAHRPETVKLADRVFNLENGVLSAGFAFAQGVDHDS